MQIQFMPVRKAQSGFALLATLAFLLVSLIIFGSIWFLISSNAIVTTQNNLYNSSQAAAEGACEVVAAQLNRDFLAGFINVYGANTYQVLVTNINQTGWPVKYTFGDPGGSSYPVGLTMAPQVWSTNMEYLDSSQFPGMYGYVLHCTITATATPQNQKYQTPATVTELIYMAGIPVFQFGVFYNMDMDLSPGQAMTMNGKTFVNGNIWMYPQATMTFNDTVAATLLVTNDDNPNDQQNLTSYITPIYNFKANGGKALSLATPVTMPLNGTNNNPTNVEAILNLPPAAFAAPNSAAYAVSNQVYLYNKCDLIVSNAAYATNATIGTNFTVYYQDQYNTPVLAKLTNEVFTFSNKVSPYTVYTTNSPYPLTTNYVKIAAGFSWLTNVSFYDYREKDIVKAVQIDVSQFNIWYTNQAFQGYKYNQLSGGSDGFSGDNGHPIASIYVYNSIASVNGSPGQLPGVRVVNGSQLPSLHGLTIVTPFPLYVQGNYNVKTNSGAALAQQSHMKTNTAWAWPAALMGDSISILSSYWSDSYSLTHTSDSTPNGRVPTNTTINAACLEGIVPSITVGGTKHYSGGLENFLRLEENWSGVTLQYNGSIVVMFPSIYGTNFWIGPGTYYNPPVRAWGFDANFTKQSGQPPAAPQVKAMIRGDWTGR